MKLQVYLPYAKKFISQKFGQNQNTSYARDGLKGHTAYDWGAPYGTPIPNCVANAYVYSLMHKDDTDPSLYRAVFTLVETDNGVFEVSYGHCSTITAKVGDILNVGDVLGYVGNTGDVFDGNHEVTRQERLEGSHAGAHLHGPQLRLVKKVTKTSKGKHYLSNQTGIYQKDGYYYEVINYENGYNGCINPYLPWSTETLATEYKKQQVVQAAVPAVAKALETVQILPPAQRGSFLTLIESILSSLAKLLN